MRAEAIITNVLSPWKLSEEDLNESKKLISLDTSNKINK